MKAVKVELSQNMRQFTLHAVSESVLSELNVVHSII